MATRIINGRIYESRDLPLPYSASDIIRRWEVYCDGEYLCTKQTTEGPPPDRRFRGSFLTETIHLAD